MKWFADARSRYLSKNNPRTQFAIILLLALGVIGLFITVKPIGERRQAPLATRENYHTLPPNYQNSVWTWESPADLSEKRVEELMEFAEDRNIKVIYLFIEDYISIIEEARNSEQEGKIAEFNRAVENFISVANEHGIEVEALAGDVNWADSSHKYLPHTLLDYVLRFNANPEHKVKFAGIQFDIEFYNEKGFKKDRIQSTQKYLSLVSDLTARVQNEDNIRLGFAVPYWLDNGRGTVPKIVFNNKKQTAMEHMLDILQDSDSYLVLMSYRNRASGNNGAIAISRGDIELADKRGGRVKIFVGLETERNKPKSITFFGKDVFAVNKTAHEIAAAFSESKSFSGVTIHTLRGYKNLDLH